MIFRNRISCFQWLTVSTHPVCNVQLKRNRLDSGKLITFPLTTALVLWKSQTTWAHVSIVPSGSIIVPDAMLFSAIHPWISTKVDPKVQHSKLVNWRQGWQELYHKIMPSPCIEDMFTTAGPTAAAALANVSLPRHPREHFESSVPPPEPWLPKLAGATDAGTKELSIGNPTGTFSAQ
jgi:hypothetical protein